jgi:hypothetical protein
MVLAVGSPDGLMRPKPARRQAAASPDTPSLDVRGTGLSSAARFAGARSVETTTLRSTSLPDPSNCLDSTSPTPAQ